jgi:hypothetical protein
VETWGFLYKINKLPKKEELLKHCADFHLALTVGSDVDIEGAPLCDELINIKKFVKNLKNPMPLNILNFIKKFNMEDLCLNIWDSLRILLTMPVPSPVVRGVFPDSKLIMTYLRSSMPQERLSSLDTLSIENAIVKNLDFSELVKTFADKKARKFNFKTFL